MIIYGTRTKKIIAGYPVPGIPCSRCGNLDTLQSSVLSRYAHFLWLPLFPVKKLVVSVCSNCNVVLSEKESEGTLRESNRELRKNSRHPFWMFSGTVFLLLVFSWFYYEWQASDRQTRDYLHAPVKGDRYEIKTASGYYTLMRVSHAENDSVWFYLNKYESNKLSEILKLDTDSNYSNLVLGYSSKDLDTMYRRNFLLKVTRND